MHTNNLRTKKAGIIFLLVIMLFSSTHAFTASGDGIETTSSLGVISATANSTNANTLAKGSMMPVGYYNGIYSGFFGLLEQINSNQTYNIDVSLVSPLNNIGRTNRSVVFVFNAVGDSISNCTLLIDGLPNTTIISPALGYIELRANLTYGKHTWSAACYDISDGEHLSSARNITILNAGNFDGNTTDFTQVNMSSIPNLTIEKSGYGKIIFSGTTDLSGAPDLNSIVILSNNSITVNTALLSELNKSATLTLFGLNFENPVVMKDGLYCSECTVLSYNGNLVFDVSHFSNYYATENSQLRIWDTTDTQIIRAGEQDNFYANFSSVATGLSINGAGISCDITFDDIGPITMNFNATSTLYYFNRSFIASGTEYYNVSCVDTNDVYTDILLSEAAVIDNSLLSGANITVISSERGNLDNPPGSIIVGGGNVTAININSTIISPSWQGYYGNISGRISLVNPNGSVFYNWELIEPRGEVYASRSPSIDFSNINCTDNVSIAQEELFLGQIASDSDTVSKTFNKTNHPDFDVGLIQIEPDKCRSTNLYVNGATQMTNYYEVLLTDSASNLIYTAIIDPNAIGFDGRPYDFQMLVGENGHNNDQQVTIYYFFMDLG